MSKLPSFSLARAILGTPEHPEIKADQEIAEQFGARATKARGTRQKVTRIPYSYFAGTRADVLGSQFSTFAPIATQFTTGLMAHAAVIKAGASILSDLEGQFHFIGNTGLSQPSSGATPETASPNSAPTFTDLSVSGGAVIQTGTLAATTSVTGLVSTAGLVSGQTVTGTGVPAGATYTVTGSTTVTLSAAATTSGPSTLTFAVPAVNQTYQPQRVSVCINVSRNLFKLSPSVFVSTFRTLIAKAVSSKINDIALFGQASNPALAGLMQQVQTQLLGGSPTTWTQYKGLRQTILQSDIQPDSYAVLMSPSMEAYTDTTPQFAGSSYTIFEKIRNQCPVIVGNEIVPAVSAGIMPTNKVLVAGLFSHLWILLWGSGFELIEDWFTAADVNQVVIHANLLMNVGVSFPQAFGVINQN